LYKPKVQITLAIVYTLDNCPRSTYTPEKFRRGVHAENQCTKVDSGVLFSLFDFAYKKQWTIPCVYGIV